MITRYDGRDLVELIQHHNSANSGDDRKIVLRIAPKNLGEQRGKNFLQVVVLPKKKPVIVESSDSLVKTQLVSTFEYLHGHQHKKANTCRRTNFVNPEGIIFSLTTGGVDYSNGVFDMSFAESSAGDDEILENSEKVDMEIVLLSRT